MLPGCGSEAEDPSADPLATALLGRAPDQVRALPETTPPGSRGGWREFAVDRVDDGGPQPALHDPAARRLRLSPGAGVRYRIEHRSSGRLKVAASTEDDGVLRVRFAWMDPADGSSSPLNEQHLAVSGQALRGDLVLPEPTGQVLQAELSWQGAAPLELRSLAVVANVKRPRPPILFLTIDTLAAQNMSIYGYARETTPRLAEFAEQCVVFDQAKANAPWTVPSYLSQLTGLYPRAHRVDDGRGDDAAVPGGEARVWKRNALAANRWTLAEMLRAAGYSTAAWIDNTLLAQVSGFSQGFDLFDDDASRRSNRDPDGGMRMILPRLREWLSARNPDEPFFAFINVLDVHGPYLPTEPYQGSFADQPVGDPEHSAPVRPGKPTMFGVIPDYLVRPMYGGEAPDRVRSAPILDAYDEKIRELDAYFGEFLAGLRDFEWFDRALIVVTADHGESMLGHSFYFRHGLLYEDAINVPLLVRLPGGERGGTRVSDAVALVDLYPTFAEFGGIPHQRSYLHGKSLFDHLRGEPGEPRPVLAQGDVMGQTSLEHRGWKLIRYEPGLASMPVLLTHPSSVAEWIQLLPGLANEYAPDKEPHEYLPTWFFDAERVEAYFAKEDPEAKRKLERFFDARGYRYELYDLERDPEERHDLAQQHAERVRELSSILRQEERRSEQAQAVASSGAEHGELSEATLEQLRSLGYVGEDD